MREKKKNNALSLRPKAGFTLIEVMIAATIVIIVSLGTLSFQYHGVKHSRIAKAHVTATRIGQLILEDWKSTGADPLYDPINLNLDFTESSPVGTGDCMITLDNQTFYIQLQNDFIDDDTVAGVELRQLRVTTRYRTDYAQGTLNASDPTIILTTYVRRDS